MFLSKRKKLPKDAERGSEHIQREDKVFEDVVQESKKDLKLEILKKLTQEANYNYQDHKKSIGDDRINELVKVEMKRHEQAIKDLSRSMLYNSLT